MTILARICAPALLIFFSLGALSAQEAVIHGHVSDEQGEPLAYASVYAVGAVIGATTDLDGKFELDVASGRVRLVVSYIGYENYDTSLVVAVADRKIDVDIVLTETFSELGEVIVSGRRASGQASALRLMQSSQSATTIIHSEVFNKYPDITLAESVSRMPGVSLIRDANQGEIVQLRGLPEQYTAIALNGQRLPNIQPEDDQSGSLDIIQSNLVDEVRITKSRTAETDADAIAGVVNFKIRQPEDQFEVLAQAAVGNNLGFDGNPEQNRGITQLAAALNSEVSEEKVYFLAAGSYLSEGRGVRSQFFDHNDDRSVFAARPYDENIQSRRTGLIGAVELRPSPLNRMRLSVNQSTLTTDIDRRQLNVTGTPTSTAASRTASTWTTERRISLVALEVENNFPRTRLDYQLSYNDSKERLDGRTRDTYAGFFDNSIPLDDLTARSSPASDALRVRQDQQDAELAETVAIGSLNITRWLNKKRTQSLKAGGRYRSKDRAYGTTNFTRTVSESNIPNNNEFPPLPTDRFITDFTDPGSPEGRVYDAKQRIAAAYLMYTANLSARFSVNAGLRYEYIEVEARDATDTVAFDDSNVLPSVNLTYRFRSDGRIRQVRLSGYSALGRPSYANFRPDSSAMALIPFEQYDRSNTSLRSTNSANVDLTYERYGRRDGLLSLGLYGKWIQAPTLRLTEFNRNLEDPRYTTQTVNTNDATVFGFEAAIYQSLGAIRDDLRHINVNATYNYNALSVDNPGNISDDIPLAQAPRQSANLSVVYSNPNTKLNLVAAVNYRDRLFDRILDGQAVWRNNLFSLDVSADYEIISNVSLFLRANNLTDHPFEEWLGQPADDGSVLRRRSFYGAWGLVGVRYRP